MVIVFFFTLLRKYPFFPLVLRSTIPVTIGLNKIALLLLFSAANSQPGAQGQLEAGRWDKIPGAHTPRVLGLELCLLSVYQERWS